MQRTEAFEIGMEIEGILEYIKTLEGKRPINKDHIEQLQRVVNRLEK